MLMLRMRSSPKVLRELAAYKEKSKTISGAASGRYMHVAWLYGGLGGCGFKEKEEVPRSSRSIQDDIVTYTTKDGAAHEFDALEFLAALSCHVPKTYESITRYYGRYSCRRRGERAKLSPPEDHEQESDYR